MVHQSHERHATAELLAYEQFLADIESNDPRLLERLMRAQLNRMPKNERPLLLMPTANDTVPQWIESSVTVEIPTPQPYSDTLLSRISSGPRRLWVLATGAFLVFLGVMFAPSIVTRSPAKRREIRREIPTSTLARPSIVGTEAAIATAIASEVLVEGEVVIVDAVVVEDVVAVEDAVVVEDVVVVEDAVVVEPKASEDLVDESFEPRDACFIETFAQEIPLPAEPELAMRAAEQADDVSDDVSDDMGEEIARAETRAFSGEHETESSVKTVSFESVPPAASVLAASDPELDSMSLFVGIGEDRWIDTRARGASDL